MHSSGAFVRQASDPMMWICETSLLSDAAGDIGTTVRNMLRVLEGQIEAYEPGQSVQANASTHPLPMTPARCSSLTRRTTTQFPTRTCQISSTSGCAACSKRDSATCSKNSFRRKRKKSARWLAGTRFDIRIRTGSFSSQNGDAMREGRRVLRPDGLGVIVFAHKSTAGWEAQLQAMIEAGWIVTASWAIDTERGTRLRARNSARLLLPYISFAAHERVPTAPSAPMTSATGAMFWPNCPAVSTTGCRVLDELMNFSSRAEKVVWLHNFTASCITCRRRSWGTACRAGCLGACVELEMNADDQADYERIKKLLDRLGKPVMMAAEAETAEIIRRRLFEWMTGQRPPMAGFC